jgi:hypothetical protein
VVGVQVADPDGVQVFEVDVVLEGGQRTAADVDEDVGSISLQ